MVGLGLLLLLLGVAACTRCASQTCSPRPSPSSQAQANIALAFGLVIAAGACTVLGALLVFFSNLANPKLLSGSLGVSAGVMM